MASPTSRFFAYDSESGQVVETTNKKLVTRPKWPMVSEAAAVPLHRIEQYNQFCKEMGVPTEHDPEGRPILTSPGHRRRYNAINKLFDRSGYD